MYTNRNDQLEIDDKPPNDLSVNTMKRDVRGKNPRPYLIREHATTLEILSVTTARGHYTNDNGNKESADIRARLEGATNSDLMLPFKKGPHPQRSVRQGMHNTAQCCRASKL